MRVAVPFAKNVYVTILSRIHGKGVAITEKGITLVISIQDMDDINWIIKSLEKLINGVSEIVKHKIKRGIFWYAVKNFENMDKFISSDYYWFLLFISYISSVPSFKRYPDY